MDFELKALERAERYRLMVNTVTPRPIAWIVSKNEQGLLNCAPFSFFNIMSAEPPLCIVGIDPNWMTGELKDTARNILATREYTINLVSEADCGTMTDSSANAPSDVSEIDALGIETVPSKFIGVPRIASAPVTLECTLHQKIDIDSPSSLFLGNILNLHIADQFIEGPADHPRVDTKGMALVARSFGRGGYLRNLDTFEEPRVDWPPPPRG